ncbi:alpha/beta fold hydrolase [Streptomyces scopuliridis]|uniref:alpha/beta fold hydrolase n=1 Tax=Streptomyces scopuliridis TaxID=452529 RepID=UPI0036A4434A
MSSAADRLGVVFVHGFLSSPETWEPFGRLIAGDPELAFVEPLLFAYASPALPRVRWRCVPDVDDIAESLKVYLETEAADHRDLVLVAHSQGGLVVQRYLARMLGTGRGADLARIRRIVLFACPNNGSQFALTLRRRWLGWNPQERQLRPLDAVVTDAQRIVINQVVHAREVTGSTCPIPITAYAGESDGIVTPASARSVFPDNGGLPGDHSTVIRPATVADRSYTALKRLLKDARGSRQDSAEGTGERSDPDADADPDPSADPDRSFGHGSVRPDHSGAAEPAARPVPTPTPIPVPRQLGRDAGAAPAYNRYLEQVRQIAPARLLDRETELDELAAFCTASDPAEPSEKDDMRGYAWWRADAWAGKSAFVSWFVLHPPATVEVASFFITARYAGQNTREAFLDKAIAQLALLSGQEAPSAVTERQQQEQLFALYRDAAHAVRKRGNRLVLVVDGLDEDRGVTVGRDAHSIAALLPAHPPLGMRIVVAGRPNPPIPEDVPAAHPLRTSRIVRHLSASPHALVVRDEARRELRGLLESEGLGRDLLGLLTAAGGGLSSADLTELTAGPPFEVEGLLRAVSGRTFGTRDSHYDPDGARKLHILGHEELQQAARDGLGPRLLDGYRQRLYAWADTYRDSGWPAGTPEYLLRGYAAMLQEASEATRLTALAIDTGRQDRLLDISGGDATALTDIARAQEVHLARAEPDLRALARLAVHDDHLTTRNTHVPIELPCVWEQLGHPVRAENLARSLAQPEQQTFALAMIAAVSGEAGDRERARSLFQEAEATARGINHLPLQLAVLGAIASGIAEMGDNDWARTLGREVETLARALTDPAESARTLSVVFAVATEMGDDDWAAPLGREVETVARALTDPAERAQTLTLAAAVVAEKGDRDVARAMACDAEKAARAVEETGQRNRLLGQLAPAFAHAGDLDRAVEVLREVTDPMQRARGYSAMAEDAVKGGDQERIKSLVSDAERAARALEDARERSHTLSELACAFALLGDAEHAGDLLGDVVDPEQRARGLAAMARAAVKSGGRERAQEWVRDAETAARAAINSWGRVRALAALSRAAAVTGDEVLARDLLLGAEATVDTVTLPAQRELAIAEVIMAAVKSGDLDRAERLTLTIKDPTAKARALAGRSRTHADEGDRERALTALLEAGSIGRTLTDPGEKTGLFAELSRVATLIGDPERARRLVLDAETAAEAITIPAQQEWRLAELVRAVASSDTDRAEGMARAYADTHADPDRDPDDAVRILAAAAEGIAEAGDQERARGLLSDLETAANSVSRHNQRNWSFTRLSRAASKSGDLDLAERSARVITNPRARGSAFAELAEAAAHTGPRAERWVAEALHLAGWSASLDALVAVAEEVVPVVADEYVRLTRVSR